MKAGFTAELREWHLVELAVRDNELLYTRCIIYTIILTKKAHWYALRQNAMNIQNTLMRTRGTETWISAPPPNFLPLNSPHHAPPPATTATFPPRRSAKNSLAASYSLDKAATSQTIFHNGDLHNPVYSGNPRNSR